MTSLVNPQINYYKEYLLNEGELDNLTIEFESAEDQKAFELALMSRIWNKKFTDLAELTPETGAENYPRTTIKYRYGVNKDSTVGTSSKVFGITHAITESQSGDKIVKIMKAYLFVYAFSQLSNKGILRVHELISTSKYDLYYSEHYYGLYHCDLPNNTGKLPNAVPLIGIVDIMDSGRVTNTYFYMPLKSFCMQGRHENIVEFAEDYKGKFEIFKPSIKTNGN